MSNVAYLAPPSTKTLFFDTVIEAGLKAKDYERANPSAEVKVFTVLGGPYKDYQAVHIKVKVGQKVIIP